MHDQATTLRKTIGGEAGPGPVSHRQWPMRGLFGRFEGGHAIAGRSMLNIPEDEPDDGLSTPDITQPLGAAGAH